MKPLGFLLLAFFILTSQSSYAGSATWNLNPASNDWKTATNWTPNTVPNDSSDIATIDVSNVTAISVAANIELSEIVFNPGASSFTFNVPVESLALNQFVFSGAGIVNDSKVMQNFVTNGATGGLTPSRLFLSGNSTLGDLVTVTNASTPLGQGSSGDGGSSEFYDSSSAGNATIISRGGLCRRCGGGHAQFTYSSTAGNATIISNGGEVPGAWGSYTSFADTSSAGRATVIAEGGVGEWAQGGRVLFGGYGNGADATLIARSGRDHGGAGRIVVTQDATGERAQVQLFKGGSLDVSGANGVVTIGSLQGEGHVSLGGTELVVGSNSATTVMTGTIADRGGLLDGEGGSLGKIGRGKLTLTGANEYTGGTTILGGILEANNNSGSATGSGPVQVEQGTLSGRGTIGGDVTVGTGTGKGAVVAPGRAAHNPVTLTMEKTNTFLADATYSCDIYSDGVPAKADGIAANGVMIAEGAAISVNDAGNTSLTPGTIFTIATNTAATPIIGTFSNLLDGGTLTVGSNTFQANYEGGDGNDLTLKVLP